MAQLIECINCIYFRGYIPYKEMCNKYDKCITRIENQEGNMNIITTTFKFFKDRRHYSGLAMS